MSEARRDIAQAVGKQNRPIRASVIIPAFRAEKFLDKAVASVLAQTERNIEVIIVDDCSPDRTWSIIESYAARDPRVKAFRLTENRGKSYIMNWATRQARGTWVAVLDADDWYAPRRLETLIDRAEAADVDMVADNFVLVDLEAKTFAGLAFPRRGATRPLDLDVFLNASSPTSRSDLGMLKPILRTDFIRNHYIEYDESTRVGEDFYFLLRFFAARGRGLLVDEPLYYYVQPFGVISRRWAQAGRQHYDFRQMINVHDHCVETLSGRFSPRQLAHLKSRRRGLKTMVCFHHIRAALKKTDLLDVAAWIMASPVQLWPLLAARAFDRCYWMFLTLLRRVRPDRDFEPAATIPMSGSSSRPTRKGS